MEMEMEYISSIEVVEWFKKDYNVTPAAVYLLFKNGSIPAVRVGGKSYRCKTADVMKFLESRKKKKDKRFKIK